MKKFDEQLLRLKTAVGMSEDQQIAELLGLSKAALSDRKRRDSFPEDRLRLLAASRPELLIDIDYVLNGASDTYALSHGKRPDYLRVADHTQRAPARPFSQSRIDPERFMRICDLLEASAKAAGRRWQNQKLIKTAIEVYNFLAVETHVTDRQIERVLKLVVTN